MRRLFKFLWRPAVSLWGTICLLALYAASYSPANLVLARIGYPRWGLVAFLNFYGPVDWMVSRSELFSSIVTLHNRMWGIDVSEIYEGAVAIAMNDVGYPAEPPFFFEVFGTILGAWLIWNFVRWINQRKVADAH